MEEKEKMPLSYAEGVDLLFVSTMNTGAGQFIDVRSATYTWDAQSALRYHRS